ncbi:MAG TPA: hypothetical protein VGC47_11190 [Acidimicrobiia bacterium]|jgi:hypothetical protein
MRRTVAVLALLVAGCSGTGGTTTGTVSASASSTTGTAGPPVTTTAAIPPDLPERMLGVGFSPLSFEGSDFDDFWDRAAGAGSVVSHAGRLDELGDPSSVLGLVAEEAQGRGLAAVIVAHPDFPLTEASVDAYIFDALSFVREHSVTFLGIGNEVNRLAPDEYEDFVLLFDRLAAAIASVSPSTIVFPVMQYEWLVGRRDGLHGDLEVPPTWEVVDDYPAAEAFGITSYPGLVFESPAAMPAGYYADLGEYTDLPIVVTATGWQSGDAPNGFAGSEDEQAAFVDRFFDLTASLPIAIAAWTHVYDQDAPVPFDTMGLVGADGSDRPAWNRWAAGG